MRKVNFDMDMLVLAFLDENLDNNYYLDLDYGEVRLVHRSLSDLRDLTDEIEKQRDRFLFIPKPDRAKSRTDLNDYLATVSDARLKTILEMALESPHPHSGFKKVLTDELGSSESLDTFLSSRTHLRIRQWLSANCIEQGEGKPGERTGRRKSSGFFDEFSQDDDDYDDESDFDDDDD